MGVLLSSMYPWMIVYSVSSASPFLIARKVMTEDPHHPQQHAKITAKGESEGTGEREFMFDSTLLTACRFCCHRLFASSRTGPGGHGTDFECSESSLALRIMGC